MKILGIHFVASENVLERSRERHSAMQVLLRRICYELRCRTLCYGMIVEMIELLLLLGVTYDDNESFGVNEDDEASLD